MKNSLQLLKQKESKILAKLSKKKTKKLESKLKFVREQIVILSKNVWSAGDCDKIHQDARKLVRKTDAKIFLTDLFTKLKSKKYESYISYYIKDKETKHKTLFMIYCRSANILICDKIEIFGTLINKFNLDTVQIKQMVFELVNKILKLNFVRCDGGKNTSDNIMSIILPNSYDFGEEIKNYPDVNSNDFFAFFKKLDDNTIDSELVDFNKERLKSVLERSIKCSNEIKCINPTKEKSLEEIIKSVESFNNDTAKPINDCIRLNISQEELNKMEIVDSGEVVNYKSESEELNKPEFNIDDLNFD